MPSITIPTRTGYTFGGYYTETNGGGTQYYTASGTSARNWDIPSATTLYAKWTANTYTVTLNQQSGSGGTTSVTATYGSAMPSITKPTRTGYTFGGYYTGTNGSGTQYYTSSGASARNWDKTAATTLYAKWTANTYTVTYNANGGSGAPSSQTKNHDVNLELSSTIPTRTNYSFMGWNTKSNGTGVSYYAGGTYAANADVTLYAIWEAWYVDETSYSISYANHVDPDDSVVEMSKRHTLDVTNYGTLVFTSSSSSDYEVCTTQLTVVAENGEYLLFRNNDAINDTFTLDVSNHTSVTFELKARGDGAINSWYWVQFNVTVSDIILKPDVPLVDTNVYGLAIAQNYDSDTGYFERTYSHTVDVADFSTLTFTSNGDAGIEGGYGRGVRLTARTNTGVVLFEKTNSDISGTFSFDVSGYDYVTFDFWGAADPSDNSWYYVQFSVLLLEIRRGY